MKKIILLLILIISSFSVTSQSLAELSILRQQQATATPPEPSAEKYYAFDASSTDYFTTTYDLNGLSDFSVVIKARFNDTSTDRSMVGGISSSTQLQARLDASNSFTFSFNDGTNTTSETFDWSADFDTDWHTFIFTFEYLTTTAEIKFYIDGVQFGATYTDTTNPFAGWVASRLFQVGRRGANSGIMNGDISYVQLYSDVLTSGEATTLQSNIDGVSGNKDLDLNQTKSTTTWTDDAVGSNDGTNGGGAVLYVVPDLFAQDNVASLLEVDALGSVSQSGAAISVAGVGKVDTEISQSGDFSVKGVQNVDDGFGRVEYSWDVTAGQNFIIKMWAKQGAQTTNPYIGSWTNLSAIVEPNVVSTSWTEFTFTGVTATTTGTATIKVIIGGTGSFAGDIVYVDNISIVRVFDSDYQAILDRADVRGFTKPSAAQQIIQNQLLEDLKTDGIWATKDLIYVPANDGSEDFGKLNWKSPTTFELVKTGTVTWTSNKGWKGDGSTGYLDTTWDAQTDGVNYAFDDAGANIWVTAMQPDLTTNNTFAFFGSSRFGGDTNLKLSHTDTSNDRLTFDVHSGGQVWLDNDSDSYLGLVSVGMDELATNEMRLYKSAIASQDVISTALAFDHANDLVINADRYNGAVINHSEIGWGWFSLGSASFIDEGKLNTLLIAYMAAL